MASIVLFLLWTALIPPVGLQLVQSATFERKVISEGLNPDIAGSGIRAGLYVPAVLSFLSIMLGCFHSHDGGVKEIGIAHLTNLASLFFNTMKATSSITGLSSEERLIAIVSIDIASTGLRSMFSDKAALASRYFIWIATMMQFRQCHSITHATMAWID
ncbi:hypothetical protein Slin15195_G019740 [Septoria linicola]|uniref:Uncharacterized protein n=1 Tax=Septoria linicola TaxID=215465 RepID=A0A9Q9ALI3_9PEZI|nr:hypothetical protein Slin15195_G019740 [Septoria linicola]